MKGKIGLEEHFATDDTLAESKGFLPDHTWPELRNRLIDFHDRRIAEMDRNGVEMMLLSLNAPAIQAILDPKRADEIARRANDFLAEQVRKRPDRFQALAALPMQDPELATNELTRCVKELGFRGALVNGFSQVHEADSMVYYDLPQYWPFWRGSRSSTCRSTCTRAIHYRARPRSTRATAGCSARPGRSRRRPRCTRCA
jgi:predicted TIM-barrel fold metal-dependent hydrolase